MKLSEKMDGYAPKYWVEEVANLEDVVKVAKTIDRNKIEATAKKHLYYVHGAIIKELTHALEALEE